MKFNGGKMVAWMDVGLGGSVGNSIFYPQSVATGVLVLVSKYK